MKRTFRVLSITLILALLLGASTFGIQQLKIQEKCNK